MPAPVFETVTKETAVKVATAVTAGFIRMVNRGGPNAQWFHTYVPTGDPVPVESDFSGGRVFSGTDSESISSPYQIDVYLWLRGNEDGEVRVDL